VYFNRRLLEFFGNLVLACREPAGGSDLPVHGRSRRQEDGMSGTTRITGVGAVGVPVTDQDRAVEFYVDTLGFEKRRDVPFGDGRWIEVAPPGATTTIALVPAGVPAGIRLATEDAVADHAELLARGADVDQEVLTMPEAPPMFGLRDPDGNSLILVQWT
jgi:catechol 2,3-dioxygenase-like lactoylglutathione lyase family enzyme